MSRQLTLIEDDQPDWRLDEHTVEIGLRGIAAAREALHQGHRPQHPSPSVRSRRAA
jgi:hypothetical protein